MSGRFDRAFYFIVKMELRDKMAKFQGLFFCFFKHQLLHFLSILFLLVEIEHGAKDMVPKRGAYTESLVVIFVVMQMMISPQGLHPFKWWIPRMNGIVHGAIHQVTQNKTREKHESILTKQ